MGVSFTCSVSFTSWCNPISFGVTCFDFLATPSEVQDEQSSLVVVSTLTLLFISSKYPSYCLLSLEASPLTPTLSFNHWLTNLPRLCKFYKSSSCSLSPPYFSIFFHNWSVYFVDVFIWFHHCFSTLASLFIARSSLASFSWWLPIYQRKILSINSWTLLQVTFPPPKHRGLRFHIKWRKKQHSFH